MRHGFLHQGDIKRLQIAPESVGTELRNVLFALFSDKRFGRIIGPTRVEMQAEHIAISALRSIGQAPKELFKIVQTGRNAAVINIPTPSSAIEIGMRCIHHAMKQHFVAMSVDHVSALNMERRQRSRHLCNRWKSGETDKNHRHQKSTMRHKPLVFHQSYH